MIEKLSNLIPTVYVSIINLLKMLIYVLIELFIYSHRLETKLNENHIERFRKYGINNKDQFLIDAITNWLIILVTNLPNFIFEGI